MDKLLKGMYLIWPDEEYIDKAINAGIDTLLVTLHSLRPDRPQSSFGTYQETVDILRMCNVKGVKVFIVPTMVHQMYWGDLSIPESERFFNGTKRLRTPCPTSKEAIRLAFEYVIPLFHLGLYSGLILDMEEYGCGQIADILPYHRDFGMDYTCRCNRCAGLSSKDQRRTHSQNLLTFLSAEKITVTGLMPYDNPYLWKAFVNETWWFTETTYDKFKVWDRVLKYTWQNKYKYGSKVKLISAGLWVERFYAGTFLEHLKLVGKSSTIDGIWIYPQARMSKHSPFHEGVTDPELAKLSNYYTSLIDSNAKEADPDFFNKLKEAFKEIEKSRNSWWFSIHRMISNIFR